MTGGTQDEPGALIAAFWLRAPGLEAAGTFAGFLRGAGLPASQEAADRAARLLGPDDSPDRVALWVVRLCFFGHPEAIWNFMIDAMTVARSDEDLGTIAAELAEHLLAHYGSMIALTERQAARDPAFARMLTGVWRHRMADSVWTRLRAVQAAVPDPLRSMIPLTMGAEETGASLTAGDRTRKNKGLYVLGPDGRWHKGSSA